MADAGASQQARARRLECATLPQCVRGRTAEPRRDAGRVTAVLQAEPRAILGQVRRAPAHRWQTESG